MQIFCSVSGPADKRRMFRRSKLEMCAFLRGNRGFWLISGPVSRGGYRMCIRLKNNRWFFSYIWEVEMFMVSLVYQAQEGRMCRRLKGQQMVFSWFEKCIGFRDQ